MKSQKARNKVPLTFCVLPFMATGESYWVLPDEYLTQRGETQEYDVEFSEPDEKVETIPGSGALKSELVKLTSPNESVLSNGFESSTPPVGSSSAVREPHSLPSGNRTAALRRPTFPSTGLGGFDAQEKL
ncbi:hypothetical protein GQ44DRAFT_728996 [Phaeosphaeriaceae sp. PMI808]|nr:hypothetical protein GQ44DRAFT_728996 [Phaeosphaeriaceae sp. PMI808]